MVDIKADPKLAPKLTEGDETPARLDPEASSPSEGVGSKTSSSLGDEAKGSAPSTVGGMPITKVGEETRWLKALLYGDSGAGKTLLAGSAYEVEEMRPVLILDVEGGTKTLEEKYPEIDVVRVRPVFTPNKRLIKTAWEVLLALYEDLRNQDYYNCFIVDSLTEVYALAMQHVMTRLVQEYPDRDPEIPSQREWGKVSSQVRRMVRYLRDIDAHVIFTTLQATQTEGQGDSRFISGYTPSLPGKLANEISGFMDIVLYLYTKEEKGVIKRYILSAPAKKRFAKDRSDKLPLTMEDPSMKKIANLVLKKGGE